MISRLRWRSFRVRIAGFVVGLLLLTLALVFFAVNRVSIDNALTRINADLEATAHAFQGVLADRNQNLLERARFLSSDHAYRQIYGFGQREDLELVTANHQRRIGADLMMLVSMNGKVLADTLDPGNEVLTGNLAGFMERAFDSVDGEAKTLLLVGDTPYQLVVVPLYAPQPVAMVVVGFRVDERLVNRLKADSNFTDVSLLFSIDEPMITTAACTLPEVLCKQQAQQLLQHRPQVDQQETRILGGQPYITRVLQLREGDTSDIAILQRSLAAELAPYYQLRKLLLLIFGASLLVSILGGLILSGSVTRPVAVLAAAARKIASGNYDTRVDVQQRDEIGDLAHTFNDMVQGLQERDQVRSLLGKVVSPQIADELMKKDIELGGEELEASILFSDIRSFTNISEAMSPQQVIQLLNHYLTEMNKIIEGHHGVVDKYIGDAVMALFGAPLTHADSPRNAVTCALEMQAAMTSVNARFAEWGIPPIAIGIGINTGTVVAGNMGSMSRLNYTVLGDAVNLASRIEGLCKFYGVGVIISEHTRDLCPGVRCMELDRVTVKGKSTPVTLYQPFDDSPGLDLVLERHQQALAAYRAQNWSLASSLFTQLYESHPDTLFQIYRDRIEQFVRHPPAEDWTGVFVLTSK